MILIQKRREKKKSWSWLDLHLFTTSTWPGCAPSLLFIATENMERHAQAVACQHPHVGFSRPNPNSNTSHKAQLLAACCYAEPSVITMESELILECTGQDVHRESRCMVPPTTCLCPNRKMEEIQSCTGGGTRTLQNTVLLPTLIDSREFSQAILQHRKQHGPLTKRVPRPQTSAIYWEVVENSQLLSSLTTSTTLRVMYVPII